MSFERGSMTFRVFRSAVEHADAVARMAEMALPDVSALSDEAVTGWTGCRHALARNITAEELLAVPGYLQASLVTAERKPPASMVAAEVKMETDAWAACNGMKAPRSVRAEIRDEVTKRLKRQTPPTLKRFGVVHQAASGLMLAEVSSLSGSDALVMRWQQTMGEGRTCRMMTASELLFNGAGLAVQSYEPMVFSVEVGSDEVAADAAMDFLTWLWFVAETQGVGELPAIMVEGPLVLAGGDHGSGALAVRVANGQPLLAPETKEALQAGKKLKSAKVSLGVGDNVWSFGLDASFLVRGLKLPPVESENAAAARLDSAFELVGMLHRLVGLFAAQVKANRAGLVRDMETWVMTRKTR